MEEKIFQTLKEFLENKDEYIAFLKGDGSEFITASNSFPVTQPAIYKFIKNPKNKEIIDSFFTPIDNLWGKREDRLPKIEYQKEYIRLHKEDEKKEHLIDASISFREIEEPNIAGFCFQLYLDPQLNFNEIERKPLLNIELTLKITSNDFICITDNDLVVFSHYLPKSAISENVEMMAGLQNSKSKQLHFRVGIEKGKYVIFIETDSETNNPVRIPAE